MTGRIGREFYDSSGYFDDDAASHITDLDSRFQRYRVAKVLELHAPGASDRVVDLGCGWGTFALDRKSTRLNSSHSQQSRMPSSA